MIKWRKSTRSAGGTANGCVEVGWPSQDVTAVRDSKNPAGGYITVPAKHWATFLNAINADKIR